MANVTVVIPVYNVERYIEKCVNSVKEQTYRDYEIVLVDDGSTDSSGDICDRLGGESSNIRVIHQTNKGLGGARNTGLENCKTKYIFFLDSDDYINPSALQRCVETAEKNACDIVFFDRVSVNEAGEKGVVYSLQAPGNQPLAREQINGIFKNPSACDKLYKTSLFTEHDIRFPEKVWYEDLRTIPKLVPFAERAVKLSGEPIYYYLQRETSIMHTPDYGRIVRERTEALSDLIDYYKQQNLYYEYREELSFAIMYHALILPCLEMHRSRGKCDAYIARLLQYVKSFGLDPASNRYFSLLRRNEKIVCRLAWRENYKMIDLLTRLNRFIKGV